MRKEFLRKVVGTALAAAMTVSVLAGCSNSASEAAVNGASRASDSNGTIMWLSNISSGAVYDAQYAYGKYMADSMGYDFKVVYGDSYNDPNGNLTAVKNGMTKDVVGIVTCQDGGIKSIMDEFPDIPVVGFNADMESVFFDNSELAVNESVKAYDMFLGTIADGHINGNDTAKQYYNYVKEQGWKKIGVLTFPGYAYPHLQEAAQEIEKLCADGGIEIVGGVVTLEFQPLDESYFQEEGRDDLDGVLAFCAGTMFVYPTMIQAKTDKLCNERTKLVTGGFDNDPSLVSDIGEDGTIALISLSPAENMGYSMELLDRKIKGEMYDDFTCERIDSIEYVIDSKEDIDNVMSKSLMGKGDAKEAQLTYEDIENCSSYKELQELFMSEQLTVDALKQR